MPFTVCINYSTIRFAAVMILIICFDCLPIVKIVDDEVMVLLEPIWEFESVEVSANKLFGVFPDVLTVLPDSPIVELITSRHCHLQIV